MKMRGRRGWLLEDLERGAGNLMERNFTSDCIYHGVCVTHVAGVKHPGRAKVSDRLSVAAASGSSRFSETLGCALSEADACLL